jgi:hypothetical protein
VKNLLAVVLVVAVGSAALSQAPQGNSKPVETLKFEQEWEYKVVIPTGGRPQGESRAQATELLLNNTAKDGWELVIVADGGFIFKRPIKPTTIYTPL